MTSKTTEPSSDRGSAVNTYNAHRSSTEPTDGSKNQNFSPNRGNQNPNGNYGRRSSSPPPPNSNRPYWNGPPPNRGYNNGNAARNTNDSNPPRGPGDTPSTTEDNSPSDNRNANGRNPRQQYYNRNSNGGAPTARPPPKTPKRGWMPRLWPSRLPHMVSREL